MNYMYMYFEEFSWIIILMTLVSFNLILPQRKQKLFMNIPVLWGFFYFRGWGGVFVDDQDKNHTSNLHNISS